MTQNAITDLLQNTLPKDITDAVSQHSAVICLATKGNPVIYVSDSFEAHTGYCAQDAVGRNLSFLQGPETEADAIQAFRNMIETATPGFVRITNYHKDGTTFIHECEMRPVLDKSGAPTHFIAIQRMV